MRTVALLSSALAVTSCSASPSEQCKELVRSACISLHSCTPTEVSREWIAEYGADVSQCQRNQEESLGCESWTDQGMCPDGSLLSEPRLSECTRDWETISCQRVRANEAPVACNAICEADSSPPPMDQCERSGGATVCVPGTESECVDACESWTGSSCCVRHAEACAEGTALGCTADDQAWTGDLCCVLAE